MPASKKKTGRPERTLNEEQWRFVEAMAKAQRDISEIAAVLSMNRKVLNDIIKRKHGMTGQQYKDQMAAHGRVGLAMKLLNEATKKNPNNTALIFACKHWLGMHDVNRQVFETPKSDGTFTVSLKRE